MIIGIDHGNYAIKTKHFSFPAGVAVYSHEPYTLKNTVQLKGKYYVCGTGRQPLMQDKTQTESYYILTLAAIAKELRHRCLPQDSKVDLAAGLPLTRYGRDKKAFTEYLFRKGESISFRFEGEFYKITIRSVTIFPQGYSALAIHPEVMQNEPSVLLMDVGGWTVDLMRLDLGMIRCMDEVREQVLRDTGLSVTDAQVESVLAGQTCTMEESAQELIRQQGGLYIDRLFSAVTEAGFDLRALPVILMGGGAATVMKHLEHRKGLCRAVVLGDDRVNAEGYERILEQMRGNGGEK